MVPIRDQQLFWVVHHACGLFVLFVWFVLLVCIACLLEPLLYRVYRKRTAIPGAPRCLPLPPKVRQESRNKFIIVFFK
jgi:hypothetical protein